MNIWTKTVMGMLAILLIVVIVVDAVMFHSIMRGNYGTPWYSRNWLKQPYTNAQLVLRSSTTHWTTNASGSEAWFVKDTMVQDKEFWTIVECNPIGE